MTDSFQPGAETNTQTNDNTKLSPPPSLATPDTKPTTKLSPVPLSLAPSTQDGHSFMLQSHMRSNPHYSLATGYHPAMSNQQLMQSMSMFGTLMTPTLATAISVAPLGDPLPQDTAAWTSIEEKYSAVAGETPDERRDRLKARKRERENQRRRERRAEARRRRDEGRRAAEALGLTSQAQIKSFLEARERQYQHQHAPYAPALPVSHAHIMAASSYPGHHYANHSHLSGINPVFRAPSAVDAGSMTSALPANAGISGVMDHGLTIPAIVPLPPVKQDQYPWEPLLTSDLLSHCEARLTGQAVPDLREAVRQFLIMDALARAALHRGDIVEVATRFAASRTSVDE